MDITHGSFKIKDITKDLVTGINNFSFVSPINISALCSLFPQWFSIEENINGESRLMTAKIIGTQTELSLTDEYGLNGYKVTPDPLIPVYFLDGHPVHRPVFKPW